MFYVNFERFFSFTTFVTSLIFLFFLIIPGSLELYLHELSGTELVLA